jgi:hypothetical protein
MATMSAKTQARIRHNIELENPFIPRCRNCGRRLRSQASIDRGFGLTCGAQFGILYIREHPTYIGKRAEPYWSKQQIKQLAVKLLA